MNHRLLQLVVAAFLVLLEGDVSGYAQTLPAVDLHPYGRYLRTDSQGIELISSAVHFGFSFSGRQCALYAYIGETTRHNYLQYELDGVYQKRIMIEGGGREPVIIKAGSGNRHSVWIYKATEAMTGPIYITKVTGEGLKALQRPEAPLIEFIGNSITCGAQADSSEFPCGTGLYDDHHNAFYAYGPRVARALKVNFILSSVSGIGIYRNWNSNSPTMPRVYENADLQEDSQRAEAGRRRWDFKRYHPRIVSIALGTNDFSPGDGHRPRLPFDSAAFVSTYIKFVQLVKSKYPEARIALLSSPMVGGDSRILLQNCLTAVSSKVDALYPSDKKIALHFFQPMKAGGCAGHPSIKDHGIIAKELVPFFKNLL